MNEDPKVRPLMPPVIRWLTQGGMGLEVREGMNLKVGDATHLIEMAEDIQRCIDREEHGGFVTAMAKGDYAAAFRNADPINRRHFGALMEYRLYYAEDPRD